MTTKPWFNVDKKGLAALMEGRDKAFIIHELIQNAWDQNVSEVHVTVERKGRNTEITVEDDDPQGFIDLAHAYTLFAESGKKIDPEKRGRFNLGEKLVLALATRARITTRTGTVTFDHEGRHESRAKRPAGSEIVVEIPLSSDDHSALLGAADILICPQNVLTTFNDRRLEARKPVARFETTLPTLIANEGGVMTKSARLTSVEVYVPRPGEPAMLFEMGIPVVPTFDRYHVNIGQKVPLNMDRDNVTPAYLRSVRVAVANATYDRLDKEDTSATWVKEALADPHIDEEAAKAILETRFGADAVAYDPSDPEANKLSTAAGRTVVHGGSLSAEEWANARRVGALLPAGKVTPSPKPYSESGKPLKLINPEAWTPGMYAAHVFAKRAAEHCLLHGVVVQFANDPQWPFSATYGRGCPLVFNVGRLGYAFFEKGITKQLVELIIHEFGHEYEADHLSEKYYDALCVLGSQMVQLALVNPEFFQ